MITKNTKNKKLVNWVYENIDELREIAKEEIDGEMEVIELMGFEELKHMPTLKSLEYDFLKHVIGDSVKCDGSPIPTLIRLIESFMYWFNGYSPKRWSQRSWYSKNGLGPNDFSYSVKNFYYGSGNIEELEECYRCFTDFKSMVTMINEPEDFVEEWGMNPPEVYVIEWSFKQNYSRLQKLSDCLNALLQCYGCTSSGSWRVGKYVCLEITEEDMLNFPIKFVNEYHLRIYNYTWFDIVDQLLYYA